MARRSDDSRATAALAPRGAETAPRDGPLPARRLAPPARRPRVAGGAPRPGGARRARADGDRLARLEAELTRARLDGLRAQLNPHFVLNALHSIAMLVRRDAARDALGGIARLGEVLRHALARQAPLLVPLRDELALLESHVAVDRLRFGDRLDVRVAVAPGTLDALVPDMLLQPLVENAIRHGIARRAGAGVVEVTSRRERGELALEVRDDGPGFAPGWDAGGARGVGLANTAERLARLYGASASLRTCSGPRGGAIVTVRLPFEAARARGRGSA